MRRIALILASSALCVGVATEASAQWATTPAPQSPTEMLHRSSTMNETGAFAPQRFGVNSADVTGRRMLHFEENIIRNGMITPSLDADSYGYAKDMSDCLIKSMGTEAESLLGDTSESEDGSIVIKATVKKYRTACIMHRGHLVPQQTLSAALAEAMLARNGATFDRRAMVVDVNRAEEFSGLVPGAAYDFEMIGRCAAVYSPGLVSDVLATEPGSKEERKALDALYASTPECGLAERPGKVPLSYQRGVFAMGLYRWWKLNHEG